MAVVTFDPAGFTARYPEFASIAVPTLQAYFDEAGTVYLNNTDASPIADTTLRSVLLNMLVAHLAALNSGVNGQAPQDGVGRVSQATEGSVSVTLDMGETTNAQAWFNQTRYGAAFWRATSSYRTWRYYTPGSVPIGIPAPWLQS